MFQRVTLIGHVGRDPEMRYTADGTPVTSLSLATKEVIGKTDRNGNPRPCPQGWKDSYNGRNWEITTWWRVTFWRGQAETINSYVTKGQVLFVEGTVSGEAVDGNLNPRVWTGQDGVARASFELTATNFKFISTRESAGTGAGGPPIGDAPPDTGYEEDVLPF